jgi:hypothetical protein
MITLLLLISAVHMPAHIQFPCDVDVPPAILRRKRKKDLR